MNRDPFTPAPLGSRSARGTVAGIGLACVVLTALASCDEPTGVGPERISVSVEVGGTPAFTLTHDFDKVAHLQCDVRFDIEVTGPGTAVWEGGSFLWYAGVDWSEPLDSAILSKADAAEAWGGDTITSSTTAPSWWRFTASSPFRVKAKFHYRGVGTTARRSTETAFTCGPSLEGASGTPTLQLLEARTSDEVPEAGDTLYVRYRIESPFLLTRSIVFLSGAFAAERRVAVPLAPFTERTEAFVIPRLSSLDSAVRVELSATDGAGQVLSQTFNTSVQIKDVTPPMLNSVYTEGGRRATGTVLSFYLNASDGHDLHRVIWETGGMSPRVDTATIGDEPLNHTQEIWFPVPESWDGPTPPLSFRVLDRAGLSSSVITVPAGAYDVFPTVTGAVSGFSFPFAGGAVAHIGDVAYDPIRDMLYVGHTFSGYVGALHLGTMTARSPLQVPGGVHGIAMTAGGDSLLLGQLTSAVLRVVDLDSWTLAGSIPLAALDTIGTAVPGTLPRPEALRVMANGMVVIRTQVASAAGDNVLTLDLASGDVRVRPDLRMGSNATELWWRDMVTSPDRQSLFLFNGACPRLYRAATDDLSPCGAALTGVEQGVSYSADGSRLMAGNRLLNSDLALLSQLSTPYQAVPHPDGLHILTSVDGQILKVRLSDGLTVARLVITTNALDRIMLLPNGTSALVFGTTFGGVFKVDLTNLM